jgi:hypothetical protein
MTLKTLADVRALMRHLPRATRERDAQGLGDADRQAPRDEKGDRRAGPPVGRDHAPHLG